MTGLPKALDAEAIKWDSQGSANTLRSKNHSPPHNTSCECHERKL